MTLNRRLVRRDKLLAQLSAQLDEVRRTGRGRLLSVRGRRQVGKSTALTMFVDDENVPYLYTTGVKGLPASRQRGSAAQDARGSRRPLPDADLLFGNAPATWTDLFAKVALAARSGPVVVVLDEFPWMTESEQTLEGELQVQWDRLLEELPVLLVLVGSDVAMMARLSEHDRPLFGRLTPITVAPLDPVEVADALGARSATEVIDCCLITGGYPRLVSSFAQASSARRFVHESLLDEHSDLVVTGRLVLDAEFADAEAAYRVLSAIGGTETARPGFNDVVSAISDPDQRHAAGTATTRALALLSGPKNLVRIDVPSGSPANTRLRRYRISDGYLRFWFRFIERAVDDIGRGRTDLARSRFDRGWASWRGRAVEPIVHEGLDRLAAVDPRLAGVNSVGAWWNRDNGTEVDVVARGEAGVLALGSVKWRGAGTFTRRDVAQLARQRAVVPGAADARLIAVVAESSSPVPDVDATFTAHDVVQGWALRP